MKKFAALLLVSGAMLSGCETAPTAEGLANQAADSAKQQLSDEIVAEIKNGKVTYSSPRSDTANSPRSTAQAKPAAQQQAITLTLSFTKMSAKLDPIAQQQLSQMMPLLKLGKKITVTGYCDQKEIGNAQRAALARATAVKTELVKLGIDANQIGTQTITKEARHAALITSE